MEVFQLLLRGKQMGMAVMQWKLYLFAWGGIEYIYVLTIHQSPFLCLCGLSDGVFPGVFLLSLWRLSGLPVVFAILFGPGLIPIIFNF
ncbi:hypothetical protein [uncultured Mesonia sp.]|uniref:hypothetical protein n=1 Tax=uncultured Mesonia sp. TaxID=399731 RepID=UPI00374F86EC